MKSSRGVFANRTLNMRSVRAIGYDMDYTIVHYHVKRWEALAFHFLRQRLVELGWPVADAVFHEDFGMRGLVIDKAHGNIVKANRFGYVKKAMHGFKTLEFEVTKSLYSHDYIDLSQDRWAFVNTFFSLSEICMFAYAVEACDAGRFSAHISYAEIAHVIRRELDEAHLEGDMKRVIMAEPDQYIDVDPDVVQTLRDQKQADKKVMLITNSDWTFTNAMMKFCCHPYMNEGENWTDLFDLVIVSARKPAFFTQDAPIYEVTGKDGLLRPVHEIRSEHKIYESGNAGLVESWLGFGGDDILYAGDHVFSDVNISKAVRRWKTCLIMRELEEEMDVLERHDVELKTLDDLMHQLEAVDTQIAQKRLEIQRDKVSGLHRHDLLVKELSDLRHQAEALESEIAPRAIASGQYYHKTWGLLMRTGNDKSMMARQMEQHADIYTSRVSNFMNATPYAYLRSVRGNLPHD